jgi:hypothetical protein
MDTTYGLALPTWIRPYTVGPQTYIPTLPGSRGSIGRIRPVRVSCKEISLGTIRQP